MPLNDYAKQITKGLFVYGEDAELRKITANAPIYYYGFEAEGNDFVASDLLRSTTVRPLQFTSVVKNWDNSTFQPLVSQYHECDCRYWSSLHSRI